MSIIKISQKGNSNFSSERKTRNGNMAFAIKLGNLFKAQEGSDSFKGLESLEMLFENLKWKDFVAGELSRSNELNDRHLGGRQRSNTDDDDDPTSRMDENMEEIMSRFNIVNNLMSKSNADDDDDDEKPEEEPENEDNPANEENAGRPSD